MSQFLDKSKPARKSRWSWYLYDFGNSAYASVVLLAVYSTYFKNAVVGGAEGTRFRHLGWRSSHSCRHPFANLWYHSRFYKR